MFTLFRLCRKDEMSRKTRWTLLLLWTGLNAFVIPAETVEPIEALFEG